MTIGTPRPFAVEWQPAAIARLKADIARVELPPAPDGAGWTIGCDRDFLERFRTHWLEGYDFAAAQAALNAHPQFLVEIDGVDIHYVHVRGEASTPRPLLVTHGWPGSVYEFQAVIERLAFPSRHGGDPADAFDLVLPSLPGYGYSGRPAQPIGPKTTAGLWHKLMMQVLGYGDFLAQGGDWGAVVTSIMGLDAMPGLRAIHLNMSALRAAASPAGEDGLAWGKQMAAAQGRNGAYAALQMTKPLSLGWATAGNPLGQAAWILERFHDWSDLRETDLETLYGLDHLITNIMLYVFTGSFPTAAWFYNGMIREGGIQLAEGQRCQTPTGFARFPLDGVQPAPPRSHVEKLYNLVHWSEQPAGGHFAAMEQPAAFATDVMAWGRKVWPAG